MTKTSPSSTSLRSQASRPARWFKLGLGFLFGEVLVERGVGVVPRTEVVQLAPDLLRPALGRVREEGKSGYGSAGLFAEGGAVESVLDVGAASADHCRGYRASNTVGADWRDGAID